jgi:hypothetical protein
VNFSHVFAGQNVGVRQVGDRIWLAALDDFRNWLIREAA